LACRITDQADSADASHELRHRMMKSRQKFANFRSMAANVHCFITRVKTAKWNQDNHRLAIQSDIVVQAKFLRTPC
jgi:hypothetical protein